MLILLQRHVVQADVCAGNLGHSGILSAMACQCKCVCGEAHSAEGAFPSHTGMQTPYSSARQGGAGAHRGPARTAQEQYQASKGGHSTHQGGGGARGQQRRSQASHNSGLEDACVISI